MSNPAARHRNRTYQRMQRSFRHVYSHAFKWAILSYGFIAVYGALYGSEPALVHRLGMTLAVLCGGIALVFGAFYALLKLSAGVTTLLDRLGREVHG
jgi:hypothetical protein